MAKAFVYVTLFCIAGLVSAASAEPSFYPSLVYPVEHRSNLRSTQEESEDPANYEFQIVPTDQYNVDENGVSQDYSPAPLLSVWDLLPTPITAVATIGKAIVVGVAGIISKALLVVKVIFEKGIWIALGASLVVGFCAFTPFCTLTIERPFARELTSIGQNINVPYLDEVERLFYQAYDKIHEMYGKK